MSVEYQLDGFAVTLNDGYQIHRTRFGEGISYDDQEGLGKAIARAIVNKPFGITSAEFKYLRKFLGLSQDRLASEYGYDSRTVSNWERGQSPVPVPMEAVIRTLSADLLGDSLSVAKAAKLAMAKMPETVPPLEFEYRDGWNLVVGRNEPQLVVRTLRAHSEIFSSLADAFIASSPVWRTTEAGLGKAESVTIHLERPMAAAL